MIPFWCLMPKGEKLRPKAKWISQPLVNFENREVKFCFLSKYSYCKMWSLMGKNFDYGEKGKFFGHSINFTIGYLSMCPNNRV
jgi:hypothetical protein